MIIRVPATSANIGPGFDSLGCALSLYAIFECEPILEGISITGCPEIYRNEENLFVKAFRAAEKEMGLPEMPFHVDIRTDVPVSRGLGSSATLLAGGVAAASAMHGDRMSRMQQLEVCNRLEGHPDNVAPAIFGGMCASVVNDGKLTTVQIPVSPKVGFIALIPDYETLTSEMRAVLPKQIPFADAIYNISRIAVLTKGFERGDLDVIAAALDDRLHQPYRIPLIHEYRRAEEAAKRLGCVSFCISGSGSTCLGVAEISRTNTIAQKLREELSDSEYHWRVYALEVDQSGTICMP